MFHWNLHRWLYTDFNFLWVSDDGGTGAWTSLCWTISAAFIRESTMALFCPSRPSETFFLGSGVDDSLISAVSFLGSEVDESLVSAALCIESRIDDAKSVWAASYADPLILSLEFASNFSWIDFIMLSVKDNFSVDLDEVEALVVINEVADVTASTGRVGIVGVDLALKKLDN